MPWNPAWWWLVLFASSCRKLRTPCNAICAYAALHCTAQEAVLCIPTDRRLPKIRLRSRQLHRLLGQVRQGATSLGGQPALQ